MIASNGQFSGSTGQFFFVHCVLPSSEKYMNYSTNITITLFFKPKQEQVVQLSGTHVSPTFLELLNESLHLIQVSQQPSFLIFSGLQSSGIGGQDFDT